MFQIAITPELIASMINHATFEVELFEFDIINPMAVTDISITLSSKSPDLGCLWYSLSGFPRCLSTEETRRRKLSPSIREMSSVALTKAQSASQRRLGH